MNYNTGEVVNLKSLNKDEKLVALKDFSEENTDLEKVLIFCLEHNFYTRACCAGHKEKGSNYIPYLFLNIGRNQLVKYQILLSNLINVFNDNIRIRITAIGLKFFLEHDPEKVKKNKIFDTDNIFTISIKFLNYNGDNFSKLMYCLQQEKFNELYKNKSIQTFNNDFFNIGDNERKTFIIDINKIKKDV